MSSSFLVLRLKPDPEYLGWVYSMSAIKARVKVMRISKVQPLPTPIELASTVDYQYCIDFDNDVDTAEAEAVLRAVLAVDAVFYCRLLREPTVLPVRSDLVEGDQCELAEIISDCLADQDCPYRDDVDILVEISGGQTIDLDFLEFLLSNAELLLCRSLLDAAELLRRSRDTCLLTPESLHFLTHRRDEFLLDPEIRIIDLESAFTDAYKAAETVLGGEPPRDLVGIERRMRAANVDPDMRIPFVDGEDTISNKMLAFRNLRGPVAAHGSAGRSQRSIRIEEVADMQLLVTAMLRTLLQLNYSPLHK